MAPAQVPNSRVRVDGKFFRLGAGRFPVKGVTYGPFAPNEQGEPFPSPDQTARDLAQVRDLGANVVRVYAVPPRWFLDLAAGHGLKVLIDIPWSQHLCVLDSPEQQRAARRAVRAAVAACAPHPAVFAYSVANELPPDVVRWSGATATARFLDALVREAKAVDPGCLCTFGNYPPTEFLRPREMDFVCFNVYLHHRRPLENYLARLQVIADTQPLLLGEFGLDSRREGETAQAEFFAWQIESAFRCGVAGAVVFSFTDDWVRGGQPVADWAFGLTTRDRQPKPAFAVVRERFAQAPGFPLPHHPRVTVVVASYNGDRTLGACLDSLERLNYPDYEVVLVDDGSTDTTPQLAAAHPRLRCFRHAENLGLSVARNTGLAAATGEIVAFTDADCRADEDWLYYLVADLLNHGCAGIGGPNFLPPEDSPVAAAVMASPGGPAHVLVADRQAEHVPGCNMAFYKSVLDELGGFDPIFTQAGDDVDLCWRLQQAGYRIGFSPAAFVWHSRRSTVREYLKQQSGYGQAEAMLVRKHPEHFNTLGGGLWRGRIYTPAKLGVLLRRPLIYHGAFGGGWFQTLYTSEPASLLMLSTTLEYHALVVLPLWVLTATLPRLVPLAITSMLVPAAVCVAAGAQACLPPARTRWWSRPLVALLFFLQPLARGWARYGGRLRRQPVPGTPRASLESLALRHGDEPLDTVNYWSEQRHDRLQFVAAVLKRLDDRSWPNRPDLGWSEFDVELQGDRWCQLQLTTAIEEHPAGRQLLRCRLRGRWSLLAGVVFWSSLGLELVIAGLGGFWWLGLPVLTLPLFHWLLARREQDLQSVVIAFLDELAKEWKLVKVRHDRAKDRWVPVG